MWMPNKNGGEPPPEDEALAEPKTNAYRALVDPRDWTCGFISRADVADFLVKQIDEDAFLYKTPVLMS
jgi:hypothetical protein